MKYLSVCSGIEAATVAWHPLGWEPLAFSEIEPFPRKVLAHHYPDVPLHGDFTILKEQPWIKDADLLVGGTPCQAFSVAGLRQSLADDRGNLTLEFVRLANAIDASRPTPSIIVWENVPGVLSVKDNAFGCFLAALVGNNSPLVPTGGKWTNAGMVIGPQRSAAWRILDAQYFGVAQRRRRVFVVASAREGFDPAEVLFEREGLRRDTAPRREKGERLADSLTVGANQYSGFSGEPVEVNNPEVAQCLTTGVGKRYDPETETLPVVGALGARTGLSIGVQDAQCGHMLPVTFALQHAQIGRKNEAGPQGKGWQEEVAFTQDSRPTADAVAIAFHPTQDPISSTDGSTHALGCGSSQGQASIAVGFYGNQGSHGSGNNEDLSVTLKADQKNAAAVQTNMAVRRLTPRECERLQGFPDDYTAIPGGADGPRYKSLGNSMAVPVMRWIGQRIKNHFELS